MHGINLCHENLNQLDEESFYGIERKQVAG
jgi:hypothetical protein